MRLGEIVPDAQHLFHNQPSGLVALEPIVSQRNLTMAKGASAREKAEDLVRYVLSN
jgi:hypothetical protein